VTELRFYLANGTLCMDLLEEFDCRSHLLKFGSDLEAVYAIFTNVLDVDERGEVTNYGDDELRAAQWIRRKCDPEYKITPPREPWEAELV